ncbi:hypothetical protein M0R45_014069 [Rubus argutus]|uniref:RING-type domain-containing protein n=1 Tax=Rubus argutus TaxID=59490 RepID=A0AAW1XKD6_RUBAR
MASSQVEMASAPFGCVLRDHNRRERCRESNARATMGAFQKNLKSLVRDHLCIAVSSNSAANESKSENQIRNADSWDQNKDEKNNSNGEREDGSGAAMSLRHARVLDRWSFARKMVSKPIERQRSEEAEVFSVPNSAPSSTRTSTSTKEDTLPRTDSLADLTKKGVGASSLVQIWEKRLNKSDSSNGNVMSETTSRSNSGVSCTENENVIVPNIPPINSSNSSPSRVSEAEKAESPVEKAGDDPIFSGEKAGDSVIYIEKARGSVDERYDAGPITEDSFEDWDGIAVSDSRNLDAREKEKVRVADIIRRLTASSSVSEDNSNDHDPQFSSAHASPCREFTCELSRERCSGFAQAEHKGGYSQVISSPRIRGRQAFADLLMQLERDRHRELDTLVDRKPVSRFPQRGRTRIQSLLRLRLLQRGVAFAGVDVPRPPPKTSRVNKPAQGSSIMHLREKFSTGSEQGSIAQRDAPSSKSPHKEIIKNTSVNVEKSTTSSNPSERIPNRASVDVHEEATPRLEVTFSRVSEATREEASPSLKVTWQETISVARNLNSQETADTATPMNGLNEIWKGKGSEDRNLDSQGAADTTTSSKDCCGNEIWKATSSEARNLDSQEITDTSTHLSGGDGCEIWKGASSKARNLDSPEIADATTQLSGGDGCEIWKGTSSKARNLNSPEIADATTPLSSGDGNEILKGTSSEARNFDTQETADTTSSLNNWNENAIWHGTSLEARNFDSQETADTTTSLVDWDENEDDYQYYGETNNDWISEISRPRSYWEHIRKSWYQEMLNTNSEKGEIHQLLERRTVSNFLSSDFRDRIDRLMALKKKKQKCKNKNKCKSKNSLHHLTLQHGVTKIMKLGMIQTEPLLYLLANSHHLDLTIQIVHNILHLNLTTLISRNALPPSGHPSMEMELIYDLRGHMVQLYQEMSELRKAIKSCVDMQMTLQQSMKQEIHSGQVKKKRNSSGLTKKGNCCICNEAKIDSLLYRCGHMCTCLKCAHELQWNSGKCPICRAPIADVVRAYMDS